MYSKPVVVGVAGCRSSRQRSRRSGATTRIGATVRCPGVAKPLAIVATLRGGVLRGTFGRSRASRRFVARRRQVPGVLLRGAATSRALPAIRSVDLAVRHSGGDVERDGVIRTELVVTFAGSATIAQANGALGAVGARIVESLPADGRVLLAIPDPGSRAALSTVIGILRARKGVAAVTPSRLVEAASLPPGYGPPTATEERDIRHLIGIGMPAAWNAKAALKPAGKPTVLVADYFGAGAMSKQLDAIVTGALGPFTTTVNGIANIPVKPVDHGYHVAGTIAANHPSDGSPSGMLTGSFPGTTTLVAEDVTDGSAEALSDRILRRVDSLTGHVIVNTSLQNTLADTVAEARAAGASWATRVRAFGLENRMLNATAAGNHAGDATLWAWRNAGARRADLALSPGGPAVPALKNTVVVENVQTAASTDHTPGCLSTDASSNFNGDIAAPGEHVWSFDHLGAPLDLSGTSMATPLVTGLAEYLWTLAPDLGAGDLRKLLIGTAKPAVTGCKPSASAPLIDAYAATLSLDEAAPLTPARTPIRLAILDRNDDGVFNEADLALWADVLHPPAAVTTRTWGRGDINGDGYVGGNTAAPFDLDRAGSTRAGTAPLATDVGATVDGSAASFDETAATDAEIVCYYAYSALYTPPAPPAPDNRKTLVGAGGANCAGDPFTLISANFGAATDTGVSIASPLPNGTTVSENFAATFNSGTSNDPTSGGHGSRTATPQPSNSTLTIPGKGTASANGSATETTTWSTDSKTHAMTVRITGTAAADAQATNPTANDDTKGAAQGNGGIFQSLSFKLAQPAVYTLSGALHGQSPDGQQGATVMLLCGSIADPLLTGTDVVTLNLTGSLPAGVCELRVNFSATARIDDLEPLPTAAATGDVTFTLTPSP